MPVIASSPSAIVSYTSSGTSASGWWLKDPVDPSRNMIVDILPQGGDLKGLRTRSVEDHAAFKALGRPTYIVISDVIREYNGVFTFEFISKAEFDKFEVLRWSQRTLFLEGFLFSMHMRFSGPAEIEMTNSQPVLYRVTIEYVEVNDVVPV